MNNLTPHKTYYLIYTLIVTITISLIGCSNGAREEISPNGKWGLAKSTSSDQIPTQYPTTVPVPGLVDLATPVLGPKGKHLHKQPFMARTNGKIALPLTLQIPTEQGAYNLTATLPYDEKTVENLHEFTIK